MPEADDELNGNELTENELTETDDELKGVPISFDEMLRRLFSLGEFPDEEEDEYDEVEAGQDEPSP